MQCGELSGWGEASPGKSPLDSEEWTAGAFAVLKDWLAPAVVGQADRLRRGVGKTARGVSRAIAAAKAALDMAWWDLHARQMEKPLHELLGGKKSAVEVGPTIDRMDSIDDFFAALGRAFDAGFARVKLMFRPGWDIRMLEAVRKEFPGQKLHIDVDGALSIHHTDILYRLDDFFLAMVEQPLAGRRFRGPCHAAGIAAHADLPEPEHPHVEPRRNGARNCTAANS